MFTGIIESTGKIVKVRSDKSNLHFTIQSNISSELKIDQSVSHDGVCLTVVNVNDHQHTVTAIQETLDKTNLKSWKEEAIINLERCMIMNGRLDGHIVQGHVDTTGICKDVKDQDGSYVFTFTYDPSLEKKGCLTVEKGSVAVNGVSLTVINSKPGSFSVAIIPYTLEHTSFGNLKQGDIVNLEFDIIGKYVARLHQLKD